MVAVLRKVGLQVNLQKSVWLAAGHRGDLPDITVDGAVLTRVDTATLLGVDLEGEEASAGAKFSKRLATCNMRLQRLPRLPVGENVRGLVAANSAISPLLYMPFGQWEAMGATWQKRAACYIKKCQSQKWTRETSPEMFWFCLHPGHRLHFPWARWYQLVRLVAAAAEWCGADMIQLLRHGDVVPKPTSITDTFLSITRELGILRVQDTLLMAEGAEFQVLRGVRPWAKYNHDLREYMRLVICRRLCRRRPLEFGGLETGFDRTRTTSGIKSLERQGLHVVAAVARKWICGALRSRDRHVRHSRMVAPVYCKVCAVKDTLPHILWQCPRWRRQRTWGQCQQDLPQSLITCGVVPSQWKEQGRWLHTYLVQAPKILMEHMAWAKQAP